LNKFRKFLNFGFDFQPNATPIKPLNTNGENAMYRKRITYSLGQDDSIVIESCGGFCDSMTEPFNWQFPAVHSQMS
jgi:hypothetical protein